MTVPGFLQTLVAAILRRKAPPSEATRPGVIAHDPDASRPHDLDDPFFDSKVQERIGDAIAKAAQKK